MKLRLLIGIGHQSHIHYAMPARIMDYDSTSYAIQRNAIQTFHEEAKDLKEDEFLSGFSRTDRLIPVVTLVLYCGNKPWDGAVHLHDILDLSKIPAELVSYIADYQIHVLDVCHTSDERLAEFPPDIYTFFLFLKYKNDPEKLKTALPSTLPVRSTTCEAIADCVGEQRLKRFIPEKKGDKVYMCKAIDMLIADGEQRGIKIGEQQGIKIGEQRGIEMEKKNTERERIRAEKAEARIRELERMLKL